MSEATFDHFPAVVEVDGNITTAYYGGSSFHPRGKEAGKVVSIDGKIIYWKLPKILRGKGQKIVTDDVNGQEPLGSHLRGKW